MPILIFEAAADGQGGVGLFVLEEHVLTVGEVGAELEQARRVDAFLIHPRGGALCGDRDIERLLDGFLVGGEVARREVKAAADLIVARHASVGREQASDVQAWQGQQVLERVLELLTRQATELRAYRTGGDGGRGQPGVEFGDEGGFIGFGWTRLLFGRRHLAVGHGVMDLDPPFELLLFRAERFQV